MSRGTKVWFHKVMANEATEGYWVEHKLRANHKGRDITKEKIYKIQFYVAVFLSGIETDRKSRNISPSRSVVASDRSRHWNLGNVDHMLRETW